MTDLRATVITGDCLDVMRDMADCSVDSIVTDPPYGLSFMGKAWDKNVPSVEVWREALRVLRPGGHLLAFAGTRTQHRMAVAIEDAGFEIRDMIAWVYGSGFPKSLDVSKAIDKAAGAERDVVGTQKATGNARGKGAAGHYANALTGVTGYEVVKDGWNITAPATEAAREWQGWGTALKPALEPITVARKPLVGTVAANVLAHGTGALNVDGCRVGMGRERIVTTNGSVNEVYGDLSYTAGEKWESHQQGRWPANLIHDGSDEVLAGFPVTGASKATAGVSRNGRSGGIMGEVGALRDGRPEGHNDNGGSAARFFYCAKASKRDRGEGNTHPTVKPAALMRYLCRLVTPPGGLILDPFTGSGSTGKAAILEGFRFIGAELDPAHAEVARARIADAIRTPTQGGFDL